MLGNKQYICYSEVVDGARERLTDALEAIVVAYYATLIKQRSDVLVNKLVGNRYE